MYLAVSEWAISVLFRCPHPRSRNQSTTSAELGGRRNQVFKNGANGLSPSKRCPKAPPLFPSPPVIVLTDQPLRNILHKPDLTGRMLQWAIELSEFGIEFQPRLSMKGQVMADFVLEYSEGLTNTRNQVKKNGGLCELMELHDHQGPESGFCYNPQLVSTWSKPSGWDSSCLNNEAEYEAILSGLDLALPYPYPSSGSTVIRNSCNSPNGQSKKSSELKMSALTPWRYSCLPPIKEVILLPIHVQTNPSVVGISTCNTIEANQTNDQEWTDNIAEYLRTALYPEIPNRHTKSGCKLPVSP
ncbi:hypothetical protein CK203_081558 [Vitis vinifera]|uniref:Reverse transcriptase RNase H-like domain-containing protein n=1 Tax=Vitis vinifera TaxID=29760 RepID=A0A438E2J0_VITVI|nr:hypothetical protein CK203_081558 [Vitis vinifera]